MKYAMWAAAVGAGLASVLAIQPAAVGADEKITFPADYAQTMTNYLSLDRTQDPDQVIRLFANAKALDAAKAGQPLPEGSTIVAEVYKAKLDKDGKVIVRSLGQRVRDKLALIAVMQKRGEGFGKDLPTELQNNGWDFAAFKPDGSDAGKDLNKCRACHAPLTDTQHLFSIEHMH